jgi:hypothetical protein
MRVRFFYLSLLASGMALFLLIHFIAIWIYGQVRIFEANTWMLVFEIFMTLAILGFSTFCGIEQIKALKNPK